MNEEILEILKNIDKRLEKIENILNSQQFYSKKMSEHIDFVDGVYDSVKKPFCKVLSLYNGGNVQIDKKRLIEES